MKFADNNRGSSCASGKLRCGYSCVQFALGNNNAQTPHVDWYERHSINYLQTALKHNLSLLNERVCYYSDRTFRCVCSVSTAQITYMETCFQLNI
jgi:hypothetical protein